MKRIIIAGARAPVALDLIRKFKHSGYHSETLDCIHFPIARFSQSSDKFHLVASPRFQNADFEKDVLALLADKNVKQIIPTCEEVFYFSKLKSKYNIPEIFTDDFLKLEKLHNKWTFSEISQEWSIKAPETFLLKNKTDVQSFNMKSSDYVFKPAYSRFASRTIVNATSEVLEEIDFSTGDWVAQKKMRGLEICVYGISFHGKLTAFAAYLPTYRVGVGAGIYLERYNDQRLVDFCQEFAQKIQFHGQFAFDFIIDENKKYHLLECNPRSTSGIHFFSDEQKFVKAVFGNNPDIYIAEDFPNRMIAAAVILFSFFNEVMKGRAGQFVKRFSIGRDIIWDIRDPLPFLGQFVTLLGFVIKAIKTGRSIHQVSSEDFEYNGEVHDS